MGLETIESIAAMLTAMSRVVWAVAVASMLVLAACGGGSDESAQPGPSAAQPETTRTATPAPTNTPSRSSTPAPTATPIPTATSVATPTLTATSIPAATPPPIASAAPCDQPGVATVQSGEAGPGELVWSFLVGEGLVIQPPAVSNGLVYFGSYRDAPEGGAAGDNSCGTFFALSADDGRELWRFPVQDATGGALVDGDLVFFGDRAATLRAIDAESGAGRWRFDAVKPTSSRPVFSTPSADGDSVYSAYADEVYALDKRTGIERWSVGVNRHAPASSGSLARPLVVGATVYVGSMDGSLYALDADTGTEQWRFDTKAIFAPPAFADGLVYIGSGDGNLYAVDASTGEERWRVRVDLGGSGGGIAQDMIVEAGVLYIIGRGRVHALDARTGREIWGGKDLAIAGPALVDGVLYVGGIDLRALDAQSGAEIWRLETSDTVRFYPLVVGDGVIYFVTRDNAVHAVAAR